MAADKVGSDTRLRHVEQYVWRLAVTVAGAVLGAVVPGLIGKGPYAILIGTILTALLTAVFTGEGPPTRAKAIIAVLLTTVAVILTVSGFTLADILRDEPVFGDQGYTFPLSPVIDLAQSLTDPTPPSPPHVSSPVPGPRPLPGFNPGSGPTPGPSAVPDLTPVPGPTPGPPAVPGPSAVPDLTPVPGPTPGPPAVPGPIPLPTTPPPPTTAPPHTPLCFGSPPTKVGTPGDDVLIGGPGRDVIAGLGGNDTIYGGGGGDDICGNEDRPVDPHTDGQDRLYGDWGGTSPSGVVGNDRLRGHNGRDILFGEGGNDKLSGDAGRDTLRGGTGNDTVAGGADSDEHEGNDGDDTLNAQDGAQDVVVNGGPGSDHCMTDTTDTPALCET